MEGINNKRSRSAAGDDDGADQLGFETPRSGVATPQPDLHDKRLPGIMSYFGQVRPASFSQIFSKALSTSGPAAAARSQSPHVAPEDKDNGYDRDATAASGPNISASITQVELVGAGVRRSLSYEMVTSCCTEPGLLSVVTQPDPYPTPPASHRSSLHLSPSSSSVGQGSQSTKPLPRRSLGPRQVSEWILVKGHARATSLLAPLPSMVTESSASALHISNPGVRAATVPSPPMRACATSGVQDPAHSPELASVTELKRLTIMTRLKSGTSTPTRLSVAAPSQAETKRDEASRASDEGPDRAAAHTPSPTGVQAPAAKGKLTIKVSEARGLKKCRDPYVIVVFQRTELISGGPQHPVEDDEAAIQAVSMGGVPIQRQGSDSGGRLAMAIPMRSRQSSNTSIHDYTTFRNRNSRRSFTNPKWDAEAIL
jgi:hypothetical protein